jgi:PAS domain S-box-containing protein
MDTSSATTASSSAAAGPRDLIKRQKVLVALGRRAIAAPDVSILMQDAASLIAETLHTEYSGSAELTPDGDRIIHTLSLESGPSDARPSRRESEAGGGDSLAGYALEVAFPVSVAELPQDTRFRDPLLQRHGVRSAIAVPLNLHGEAFGALLACSRQPQRFDDDDVAFVEAVAHLITTTIGRVRAEKSLASQGRLAAAVFDTVGAIVAVLDEQGRIRRANRACERITGFSAEEIAERPIWDLFPVPSEADLLQTIVKRVARGAETADHECQLLTKHSERRQIRWSFSVVRDRNQLIESVVASGIDVTDEREAEQRAAEAEQQVAELKEKAAEAEEAAADSDFASKPSGEGPSEASLDDAESTDPAAQPADLPGPINRERRRRARLSYPYCQRIAPILDGRLPDDDEFVQIQCNDIAAGGFSFISTKPMQSDMLVVALGTPPRLTYLTAQVAHVTRIERDGERMYLVGCSYIGRVAY